MWRKWHKLLPDRDAVPDEAHDNLGEIELELTWRRDAELARRKRDERRAREAREKFADNAAGALLDAAERGDFARCAELMEAAAPEVSKAKAMFMAKKEKIAKRSSTLTVDKRALAKQPARAAPPRNHYTDAELIAGAAAEANPNRHRGASGAVLRPSARPRACCALVCSRTAPIRTRALSVGLHAADGGRVRHRGRRRVGGLERATARATCAHHRGRA